MPRNFVQMAVRAGAALAAVLALVVALSELNATREYGPYLALTSLFRKHEPVSDRAVIHHAKSLDPAIDSCRTDILNAVVSVSQREAELQFVGDRTEWPAALARLEQVLRSALACNPTNGDFWARLAATRWLVGGSAEEQISLMTLSQTYSPANLDTIRKRLRHWNSVTQPMAMLGEDLIRRDIRTMLLYAPEKDAVSVLGNMPAHLQSLVRSEEAVVPRARLDALKAAGLAVDGA